MKVHDLKPAPGSRTSPQASVRHRRQGRQDRRSRHKGQKARNTVPVGFEGGQLPLHMKVPKLKGFNNPFRVEYQAINLDTIDECGLDEVTPDALHDKGLTHKGALIKVLARGELTRAVTVKAHGFSKAAEAAITAAGGSVEVLPKPWGDRRPPAKGNQFTNR
ncbi:MAG: 50S ribosomal protein L15 [Acidimicrobiales bacterium]